MLVAIGKEEFAILLFRLLHCGSSSAVECLLAKEKVAGANPVSRS